MRSLRRSVAVLLVLVPALLLAALPLRAASPSPGPGGLPDLRAPGPYAAGLRNVDVVTPDGEFGALVRYPAAAPGGTDAHLAEGAWPLVIFAHGRLAPPELYDATLAHLATWGYLVIAPRTAGGPVSPHDLYARDLLATIDWAETESTDPASWLAGAVAPGPVALAGHSMGGGASVLAGADPRIGALVLLAPAETRPSATAAAAAITAPVLILAGDHDAITPPAIHALPIRDGLTGAMSQLRMLAGGSHCGFTDLDGAGLAGELARAACDSGPMPVAEQLARTNAAAVAWLGRTLRGDPSLAPLAEGAAGDEQERIELRLPG